MEEVRGIGYHQGKYRGIEEYEPHEIEPESPPVTPSGPPPAPP